MVWKIATRGGLSGRIMARANRGRSIAVSMCSVVDSSCRVCFFSLFLLLHSKYLVCNVLYVLGELQQLCMKDGFLTNAVAAWATPPAPGHSNQIAGNTQQS